MAGFPKETFALLSLGTFFILFAIFYQPLVDFNDRHIACFKLKPFNYEFWHDLTHGRIKSSVVVGAWVETFFILLIVCNVWTVSINPEIYADNQILRMFNSNNPCVGWDMLPTSFLACVGTAYMCGVGFCGISSLERSY